MVTSNPDTLRKSRCAISCERTSAATVPIPILFDGAPDLAVEVKSRGARTNIVIRKVEQYLANGARVVWVVATG